MGATKGVAGGNVDVVAARLIVRRLSLGAERIAVGTDVGVLVVAIVDAVGIVIGRDELPVACNCWRTGYVAPPRVRPGPPAARARSESQ